MSESLVGVSVAVTRQNAGSTAYGDELPARPVAPGGVNAPGGMTEAEVTLPAASGSALSDSQDAAPVRISSAEAGSLETSRELTVSAATKTRLPVAIPRILIGRDEVIVVMARDCTTRAECCPTWLALERRSQRHADDSWETRGDVRVAVGVGKVLRVEEVLDVRLETQ